MSKVCLLDSSIVLDILNGRERTPKVSAFLEDFENYAISSKTFFTVLYILRKTGRTMQDIQDQLSFVEILEVNQNHCWESLKMAKNLDDTEDCCELILAKENGLWFVTADKELAKNYAYKKLVLIA